IKDLFGFEFCGIEVDLGLAEDSTLASLYVIAIDGRWHGETGKGIKRFFISAFPSESNSGTESGQPDLADEFSSQVEDLDLRMRIFQIRSDKLVADEAYTFERLFRFGDNPAQIFAARFARID